MLQNKNFNSTEEAEYALLEDNYQEKNLDYLYESRRAIEDCIAECIKTRSLEHSLKHLAGFWREQYVIEEIIKRKESEEKPRVIN